MPGCAYAAERPRRPRRIVRRAYASRSDALRSTAGPGLGAQRRVVQIAAADHRKLFVEREQQRPAGSDREPRHLLVRDRVEQAHERAQRVLVADHEHAASLAQLGREARSPERADPIDGVAQAFGDGKLARFEPRVARIARRMARIVERQRGRRSGETMLARPHLARAVTPERLEATQPLERAEVSLVQVPGFDDRNRCEPHRQQRDPQGVDPAPQHRGKADVGAEAVRDQQLTRPARLFSPRAVSGTSVQPVNRWSRFQVLSPCRRSTKGFRVGSGGAGIAKARSPSGPRLTTARESAKRALSRTRRFPGGGWLAAARRA